MAGVLQVWLEDIGFPAAVGDGRPRGLCCCHPSEDLGSDYEPPLEEEQNLASVYAEPPGTLSLRSSGLHLTLLCFAVFVCIHLAKYLLAWRTTWLSVKSYRSVAQPGASWGPSHRVSALLSQLWTLPGIVFLDLLLFFFFLNFSIIHLSWSFFSFFSIFFAMHICTQPKPAWPHPLHFEMSTVLLG